MGRRPSQAVPESNVVLAWGGTVRERKLSRHCGCVVGVLEETPTCGIPAVCGDAHGPDGRLGARAFGRGQSAHGWARWSTSTGRQPGSCIAPWTAREHCGRGGMAQRAELRVPWAPAVGRYQSSPPPGEPSVGRKTTIDLADRSSAYEKRLAIAVSSGDWGPARTRAHGALPHGHNPPRVHPAGCRRADVTLRPRDGRHWSRCAPPPSRHACARHGASIRHAPVRARPGPGHPPACDSGAQRPGRFCRAPPPRSLEAAPGRREFAASPRAAPSAGGPPPAHGDMSSWWHP